MKKLISNRKQGLVGLALIGVVAFPLLGSPASASTGGGSLFEIKSVNTAEPTVNATAGLNGQIKSEAPSGVPQLNCGNGYLIDLTEEFLDRSDFNYEFLRAAQLNDDYSLINYDAEGWGGIVEFDPDTQGLVGPGTATTPHEVLWAYRTEVNRVGYYPCIPYDLDGNNA